MVRRINYFVEFLPFWWSSSMSRPAFSTLLMVALDPSASKARCALLDRLLTLVPIYLFSISSWKIAISQFSAEL
jgi:hypothetical protein